MERNLRLYPVYQALRGAYFHLPIFFLYFLSVVSLAEALTLEAIYYLAVVALEVPSGYFSDRVGRRLTLSIGATCGVASAALFVTGGSFAPLAWAQGLLAASNAFNSGTDTSLLYDSLFALRREGEIAERESRAYGISLVATSAACLTGGLAAGFDLRAGWILRGLAELGALAVALRFAEPPRDGVRTTPRGAGREVLACLADPRLAWVFTFAVAMVVLNHVPYEFFQPYLDLLFAPRDGAVYQPTPAIAGALAAAMALLGAWASLRAVAARSRIGVRPTLLAAMALQLAVIAGMALVLSPWIVLLILCRSVPMALSQPLVNAEIHPRVPTAIRATYFSFQSLAGRLAFSACLALASRSVSGAPPSHAVMAGVLFAFLLAGLALGAALAWTARHTGRPDRPSPAPPVRD